ncbi:GDSL-type esterase/lipase family protein [Ideonella margarita]|uniref:GDSL-type esterase/lipase family protein n=1 Tax=Ideonella margarita TaxID=2984191 RepID=A0ABU9C466_9BURK
MTALTTMTPTPHPPRSTKAAHRRHLPARQWPALAAAVLLNLGLNLGLSAAVHAAEPPAINLTGPWTVTDFEGRAALTGAQVVVPKPAQPRVPASRVTATQANGTVGLQFKDSWIAQLRLEDGPPLDLRPYLAEGTLEMDIDVREMADGGLKFKMNCASEHCERKVPWLPEARAVAGKGWRHVALALRCFMREGDDFSRVTVPFTLEGMGTGEVALRQVRIVARGQANAACPDYRTQSVTPIPLQESWAMNWWMPRHEKKLTEIRAHRDAGRDVKLVFIGDSITEGWENAGQAAWQAHFARHNAMALGYGGDRTENVLWRLQNGELDGMTPKVVVLMIGTNNTGDRQEDPRTTAAGIRRLLTEIQTRQPATQVLLLAIYPREQQAGGPLRAINDQVNALIAPMADGRRVHFLNINRHLMQADGSLSADVMPDWLHLSPAGYERVAQAIEPVIEQLLAR